MILQYLTKKDKVFLKTWAIILGGMALSILIYCCTVENIFSKI